MSAIKGLHHVALKIPAAELEKSVQFYNGLLEMPVIRQWDGGIMLGFGNTILEIIAEEGHEGAHRGALNHFAFATDEPDALIEKCRAAGYTVTMEPTDINIGGNYPARVCFIVGPSGESIEFFKER